MFDHRILFAFSEILFSCVLIIIHAFQMDNNELMKYYLNVYDHNSCISNGHELLFHNYYFNVCDNN